jgi:hypothetical protein
MFKVSEVQDRFLKGSCIAHSSIMRFLPWDVKYIITKERARSRLSNDLRTHLSELGRSRPHQEAPASFEPLAALLIASAQGERDGLRGTISELLGAAHVIALDAAILRSAAGVQTQYSISGQDAIVLASVITHLEIHRPAQSCFLNRNSKDFDDPNIRGGKWVRGAPEKVRSLAERPDRGQPATRR